MNPAFSGRSKSTRPMSLQPLEVRRLCAADLTISAIDLTPGVHETHEYTEATFTIRNKGTTNVPAGVGLTLAFSKDEIIGNSDDWSLGTVTVTSAIPAKGSTEYKMVRRASAQGTGFFRLIGYIDGRGKLAESSETNNQAMTAAESVVYANDLVDADFIKTNHVEGTKKKDDIYFRHQDGAALILINGKVHQRKLSEVTSFTVSSGAGNDKVTASADFPVKLDVNGGSGNDTLVGGVANDTLYGGKGHDRIYGNGGANDLRGGTGADLLFAKGNNAIDSLSGGGGSDRADRDASDIVSSVEKSL